MDRRHGKAAGYEAVPTMPTGINVGQPPAENPGPYNVTTYSTGVPINNPGPGSNYVYQSSPGEVAGHHAAQQRPADQPPAATNSAGNGTFFIEEDVYRMSPHVKVQYDEVFKESEGANNFELFVESNRLLFKWTQLVVYRFLSFILGILLVFIWGVLFALITFIMVYLFQPVVKITFVVLRPVAMLYKAVVRSFLDPLWQSMGLVFSRVMGRFAFNFSGLHKATETEQQAAIQQI